MEKKIVIKREDFSKFLSTIELIQEHCNDCEVFEGSVRQKSNDKHTVFDFDLTKVMGDTSMDITALKKKVMLLKSFELDTTTLPENADQNIVFATDDTHYIFSDLYSTIKMRIPLKKYLDNRYMTEEDLAGIFKTNEEDLIMSTTINSYLSKRVKLVTRGFENDTIILQMNEFKASILAETTNKENTSQLIRDIELNTKMPNCQSRMVALPFGLELASDVSMNVYKQTGKEILAKFSMKFFGVPITIYARSEITSVKGDK